jgi:hypothetical protein
MWLLADGCVVWLLADGCVVWLIAAGCLMWVHGVCMWMLDVRG